MDRFIYYNPNPKHRRSIDCTVRAICKATGYSWNYVHSMICMMSNVEADMPSTNAVWGNFLRLNGYERHIVDDHGRGGYTLRDFCRDNPEGTYVVGLDGHVVCVDGGYYFDTWDSGDEVPIYYWKR